MVGSLGDTLVEERDLKGYRVSPDIVRYFCDRCSAKMFMCKNETDWYVSGGVLEKTEGIVKLGHHVHVAETKDGGIADQLPTVDGVDLPRYSAGKGSEELPMGWRSDSLKSKQELKGTDCLNAYCQCGAIKIYITRPNCNITAVACDFPKPFRLLLLLLLLCFISMETSYYLSHLSTYKYPSSCMLR